MVGLDLTPTTSSSAPCNVFLKTTEVCAGVPTYMWEGVLLYLQTLCNIGALFVVVFVAGRKEWNWWRVCRPRRSSTHDEEEAGLVGNGLQFDQKEGAL